mgnify:CR=1 FL=1
MAQNFIKDGPSSVVRLSQSEEEASGETVVSFWKMVLVK